MKPTRPTPSTEFSTYPLEQLRALWGQEKLTADQMVGHFVQHLIDQHNRLLRLEHPSATPPGKPLNPHRPV